MTEQEFGNIARENRARLEALARRFRRAADQAVNEEDVVQEALLALWNLSEKGYPLMLMLNPSSRRGFTSSRIRVSLNFSSPCCGVGRAMV